MNLFLFFYFYFKGLSSALNHDEFTISLDLIKALEIRHCVLLGDQKNLITVVKSFSVAKIPITYLNWKFLIDYIGRNEKVPCRTGIIFKHKTLFILNEISRVFDKVSIVDIKIMTGSTNNTVSLFKANQSYQLQNFIWIVFPTNLTETSQINQLIIPYDCEFIVVQSKIGTGYELKEIYTVKNKLFTLDFGIWDKNFGLRHSNESFYRRKSNFNAIEIDILSDDDSVRKFQKN